MRGLQGVGVQMKEQRLVDHRPKPDPTATGKLPQNGTVMVIATATVTEMEFTHERAAPRHRRWRPHAFLPVEYPLRRAWRPTNWAASP